MFMATTILYTYKTATRLYDERAGRICVLLLIGCLGLILRAHEINPEIAGLAGYSIAIYGLLRLRSEPRKGGITTGVGSSTHIMKKGIGHYLYHKLRLATFCQHNLPVPVRNGGFAGWNVRAGLHPRPYEASSRRTRNRTGGGMIR